MSTFINPRGQPTFGIGICDRCKKKFPLAKLRRDVNSPGLYVCEKDADQLDRYRLPPRQAENVNLPFVRPDESLALAVGVEVPILAPQPPDSAPPTALRAPRAITGAGIFGTFQTGSQLSVVNGTWDGNPDPGFVFQWQSSLDNSNWGSNGATGTTYTVLNTDSGHYLRCAVIGTNSQGSAVTYTASAKVASGAGPVLISAPLLSTPVTVGQAVTTTDGVWGNGPSFAYAWSRSLDGSNWTSIGGATTNSYTPVVGDAGYQLQCTVTATNGFNTAAASTAAGGPVTLAPSNTLQPTVVGTAAVGSLLTANPQTWDGYPVPTFDFQWESSLNGSPWAPITGATTSTYTPVAGDAGSQMRIKITGRNSAGSSTATSIATTPVVNTAKPSNTAAPVLSGGTQNGSILALTDGSWQGATPPYAYKWQRATDPLAPDASWSDIAGFTTNSYTVAVGDVGYYIRGVVTASNAYGSTAKASNPTAQITNVQPPNNQIVYNLMGPYLTSAQTTALGGQFAAWEANFASKAPTWWTGQGAAVGDLGSGATGFDYYDRGMIWYVQWARTGIPEYLQHGHDQVDSYRQNYVEPNGYLIHEWWFFPVGLAIKYLLTGDTAAQTTVGKFADILSGNVSNWIPSIRDTATTTGWMDVRTAAYGFRNLIMAHYINAPSTGVNQYLTAMPITYEGVTYTTWKQWCKKYLDEILAVQQSSGYWTWGGYPCKPFMLALLCDALRLYYTLVDPDPRIPMAVKRCADDMYTRCYDATSHSMMYLEFASSSETTFTTPDLSWEIAPVYGWIYNLTGDTSYKTKGDDLWNHATLPVGFDQYYFGAGKQFNECFNFTWRYPYYSSQAPGSLNLGAPFNNTVPSAAGNPQVGTTLLGNAGTWTNTVVSTTYQWQSSTTPTVEASWGTITGATAIDYTPVSGDVNAYVRLVVTKTNASGSGTAHSNPIGPITASAVVTWDPATAKKSSHITLSNGNIDAVTDTDWVWNNVFSTLPLSGKKFWRVKVIAGEVGGGIATLSETLDGFPTTVAGSYFYNPSSGAVATSTDPYAYNGPYPQANGDIIDFAIDTTANKFWIGRNGTWVTQVGVAGNPATGVGSIPIAAATTYYPLLGLLNPGAAAKGEGIFFDDSSGLCPSGFFWLGVAPSGGVAAPSNSVAPSISGTAQVTRTLIGSEGTWSGSITSTSYVWETSATGTAGTFSPITGATGTSYTVQSGDLNQYLRFTVTKVGPGGTTVRSSGATAQVIASGAVTLSSTDKGANAQVSADLLSVTNLLSSGSFAQTGARSTSSLPNQKVYFRFKVEAGQALCGIATNSEPFEGSGAGYSLATSYALGQAAGGGLFSNGTSYADTAPVGGTFPSYPFYVDFAVDVPGGKIYVGINNDYHGYTNVSHDPATGTNPATIATGVSYFVQAGVINNGVTGKITLVAKDDGLGTLPSGFTWLGT